MKIRKQGNYYIIEGLGAFLATPLEDAKKPKFKAGDRVYYNNPDGVKRCGTVVDLSPSNPFRMKVESLYPSIKPVFAKFDNSLEPHGWMPEDELFFDAPAQPAEKPKDDKPVQSGADILTTAAKLISGDRDRTHGDKHTNFKNIARVWEAYLRNLFGEDIEITPQDVGVMMVLFKMARTQTGAFNLDDFIDAAGYAACAAEIGQQDQLCA